MLDPTIALLRAALKEIQQDWLAQLRNALQAGRELNSTAANLQGSMDTQQTLSRAFVSGWAQGWQAAGAEVITELRKRPQAPDALAFAVAAPAQAPTGWRTWAETHPEGGQAVSRQTWEWLAEHEATLQQTLPVEYVTRYVRNRMPPLAGIVDQHLISATRDIAAGISERGFGVRESMRALQTQFPSFTDWRLENIARTEGAVLYETGHLARYRSDAAVQGIRFDAIRDSRTSEICLAHDGKCWRLSDPNLPAPPLHYMCRSTLTPILFDEQPDWQDGPLGEDAQPLAGFGRVNESLLPPNVLLP